MLESFLNHELALKLRKPLSPRFFTREDYPKEITSMIDNLVVDLANKQGKQGDKDFKFPNEKLVSQVDLVNRWWAKLDLTNSREITKREMASFLLEKGIIRKELEVERLFKAMTGDTIADGYVRKSQFIKCFTRVILKAAILNIFFYAKHNAKIGDEIVPQTLKVLKFQRDLLIGGLKNQPEKLGVDCRSVVKGLSKLK